MFQYFQPVTWVCTISVYAAALLMIPFLISRRRRYGKNTVDRVLITYSFLLYMLCVFSLTFFPFPTAAQLKSDTAATIQWIPFSTYANSIGTILYYLKQPETFMALPYWDRYKVYNTFLEIIANIIVQMPLGIYLRRFFHKSRKQTILIGFLVSLFYETTQLTGFWFVFSKAYRTFSVDDLFDNTLGALLGYKLASVFPPRIFFRSSSSDECSEEVQEASAWRQIAAALIDWLLWLLPCMSLIHLFSGKIQYIWMIAVCLFGAFLIIVLIQHLGKGQTLGKKWLKLSVRDAKTGGRPRFSQLLIRYSVLYAVTPFCIAVSYQLFCYFAFSLFSLKIDPDEISIVGSCCSVQIPVLLLGLLYKKHKAFPHEYLSKTRILFEPLPTSVKNKTGNAKEIAENNPLQETADESKAQSVTGKPKCVENVSLKKNCQSRTGSPESEMVAQKSLQKGRQKVIVKLGCFHPKKRKQKGHHGYRKH